MKRYWKWVWAALLLFILVTLAIPPISCPITRGIRIKNIANARQLGLAARLFAEDHQHRLPADLSEVVPEYCDPTAWESLRFDPRESVKDAPLPKYDWLYFGAAFDQENPPPLLIASPQASSVGKAGKRIVVLGDLSASVIMETQYQELLRKTIEAMHQRRDGVKSTVKESAE